MTSGPVCVPAYKMSNFALHNADWLKIAPTLPDNSVESVVTDPPYELGFMGKGWDSSGIAYNVEVWKEALRILKPGGHLLAFGGSRTYHRLAVAIEDAGFEIRDQIQWIYGSGFPKSLDVSKAIDKMQGAEREVISKGDPVKRMIPGADQDKTGNWIKNNGREFVPTITTPATDEAKEWEGFGTALKPAHEPIVVARKPLSEQTVAENVLKWGTGAINIDGCRIEHKTINGGNLADNPHLRGTKLRSAPVVTGFGKAGDETDLTSQKGRFPANVIHDGSDEILDAFPDAPGQLRPNQNDQRSQGTVYGKIQNNGTHIYEPRGDTGSAARYFYCAKASGEDRADWNTHPTVKPVALMRYLCRLVTPPGGTIVDPFMGSGTTGVAAEIEGFKFIGVENDTEHGYFEIGEVRIKRANLIPCDVPQRELPQRGLRSEQNGLFD